MTVSRVKAWMTTSKLKLNDDKTEVLIMSSVYYGKSLPSKRLEIGETVVECSNSTRNIGVIFDINLSMKQQISSVCRSTHYHQKNIGVIRKVITKDACIPIQPIHTCTLITTS